MSINPEAVSIGGKTTESESSEQQQQFQALIWASAQIVWTTNAAGFVEEDSPMWREYTGQTFDEWKGFGWLDVIHEDDRERVQAEWQAAVAAKKPVEIEYRLRHKSGEWLWTIVRAAPIFDEYGAIKKWVGMNTDINHRKQSEMNLAFLAEISRDLVSLVSIDEIMETVGAKIGAFLNLSLCVFAEINEAAGEAVITHDWHRQDVPGGIGVHRLEDFVSNEYQRLSRAGEIFVVSDTQTDSRTDAAQYAAFKIRSFLSVPLIRHGEWKFQLTVNRSEPHDWRAEEIELVRELTTRIWTRLERAHAEEKLRQSEEKYRTLFETMDEGFCVIEMIFGNDEQPADYRFLQINPSFERQSGLTDALGKTMRELAPDSD